MPVVNGIGYGEHTVHKQDDFQAELHKHMLIAKAVMKRNGWFDGVYHYFDINAGCGIYEGITGSPLIFLAEARATGVEYRAYFVEIDPVNCASLDREVQMRRSGWGVASVVNKDHDNFLATVEDSSPGRKLGLLYHDPSGEIPSFTALASASINPLFKHVDFMIYLSAANMKRVRRAHGHDHTQLLTEYLEAIGKSKWVVRRPMGKHQWTFLIGSNWLDYPDYQKRGFFFVDSPEGQAILAKLTYSKNEANDAEGLPLFCAA